MSMVWTPLDREVIHFGSPIGKQYPRADGLIVKSQSPRVELEIPQNTQKETPIDDALE